MAGFRTLDDLDVAGKRVLVRVDLNVPMKDGVVGDRTRLERVVPTLADLADRGARVILLAHFGRPKGARVDDMSLAPVAEALAETLGRPVGFARDCIGPVAAEAVADMSDGDILLLENLRFHAGEEKNDPAFAAALAQSGDLYVNDAFSAAHRAHASTEGLAHLLPAAAGRAMQGELEALESALGNPARPAMAIVGGAKVSTKLDVLGNISGKVDQLVIGGGMANTFLHAQGVDVGASLCERDLADTARQIMQTATTNGCEIVLPVDAVVAASLAEGVDTKIVDIGQVPGDAMILDIGPRAAEDIAARIAACRTVLWNGPVGAFEVPPFDVATNRIAQAVADATIGGTLTSVAGGGDTVAALAHAGVEQHMTYVSTAGGAFLEWLEGKDLPGVKALETA